MLAAFKKELHRALDPLVAWHTGQRERAGLRHLSDGVYRVPIEVPYVPQFASPELIADYIHHGYDGRHDPLWQNFGADDPSDYAFWAHRVCALAVIKMAAAAFDPHQQPTLWEMVELGLGLNGYQVYDARGRLIDHGWHFPAQVALAERYGLKMRGYSYAPIEGICRPILEGKLVSVTVSPELGERQPRSRRYGGHVVLVYGFEWRAGSLKNLLLHNPSGRYPELQADACLPLDRFKQHYAYRFATLEPLSSS